MSNRNSNTKVWSIITIISLLFGMVGTTIGIYALIKPEKTPPPLDYWSNINKKGYTISSTSWTTGTNLYVNFTLGTIEYVHAIYTGQVNISVNGDGNDDGIEIRWCLNNQSNTENPSLVVSAADEGNPKYHLTSVVLQWYITEPPGSYNLTIMVKGLTTSTVLLTENVIFVAPCIPHL